MVIATVACSLGACVPPARQTMWPAFACVLLGHAVQLALPAAVLTALPAQAWQGWLGSRL